MSQFLRKPMWIIGAVVVLLACGGEAPQEATADDEDAVALAESLSPSDSGLADLYASSCQTCHTSADSGAPLTGDVEAWADRLDQGMDTLLDHTIDGFGGMPPLGSCMDCSEEDFEALIEFMSSGE